MEAFLKDAGLSDFLQALSDLGVQKLDDLKDLEADDLEEIGMISGSKKSVMVSGSGQAEENIAETVGGKPFKRWACHKGLCRLTTVQHFVSAAAAPVSPIV